MFFFCHYPLHFPPKKKFMFYFEFVKKKMEIKSTLLVDAFPAIKIKYEDTNTDFGLLFQQAAYEVQSYLRQFQQDPPNLNAYRYYIYLLSTRRGGFLRTIYADPFSEKAFEGSSVDIELANTIWNFISALLKYMISLDSSDNEKLKSMKIILSDLFCCVNALKDTVVTFSHPFLTHQFVSFLESYVQYICNFWQFSVIYTQKQSASPRPCMRCIEDIRSCFEKLKGINPNAKNHFLPVLEITDVYLKTFVRYQLGMNSKEALSIAKSLIMLNSAIDESFKYQSHSSSIPTYFSVALNILKDKIKSQIAILNKENENIYYEKSSESFELPLPYENYTPSQGVPLFQPPPGYQILSSPPPNIMPQSSQQPQNIVSQPQTMMHTISSDFPEWDQLNEFKISLYNKMNDLKIKYPDVCSKLNDQMNIAAQNDSIIQTEIDKYRENPMTSIDTIHKMIEQAQEFYKSMNLRLYRLEQTGQ